MHFIACTAHQHAEAILEILNDAIVHSTALYDYIPRTMDNMDAWFDAKANGRFPIIGAVDDNEHLLAFATYGTFRAWPAYKYTVEHSVYVHRHHRGQGIGWVLMHQLTAAAVQQQYHSMIGVIDMNNTISISMHEKLGFVHAGTLKQAGFKFGRWLDVGLYQLLLPGSPAHPVDG